MDKSIQQAVVAPKASHHGMGGRLALAEQAVTKAAPGTMGTAAVTPGGKKGSGFFDYMFPGLPGLTASEDDLEVLANAMKDASPGDGTLDNLKIPAGFTYLGQFVDHDITLDVTTLSERLDDPTMLKNFRTPGLDLDCLYGSGQGPHRFLYRQDPGGGDDSITLRAKFLIGTATQSPDVPPAPDIPDLPNDLERGRHGVALIGDHRNDENLLVAQTHLAMLKFHNRTVDHLRQKKGVPAMDVFAEASKQVRWHYQWMVLHDWVERLCGTGIVARILNDGRKFYRFQSVPFMPLEFAGAAYRLGHSMVREEYSHNRCFRPFQPRLFRADLEQLFRFTSLSGGIGGDLGPLGALPSDWVIDWRRYFDFKTPAGTPNFEFNHSRKLDPFITGKLHQLPGFPPGREANLAFRNLRRGVKLGLPSGQDVAKFMNLPVLTEAEISTGPDGAAAASVGLHKKTPLWYYILKEAQVKGGGERLGPVGSQIVAEVFVGLVQGDRDSYLSQPGWKPTLPAKVMGTFNMTDLLQFVGEISPIDGITTVATL